MIKQKEAVFAAITAALEQGLEGDAAQAFAVEQVKTGLMAGEIQHSSGAITDPKKAESYAKALIANWKKKDQRLNGGTAYVPTNRRGPIMKDDTLKKLNESLKSLKVNQPGNTALIERVETAITNRKTELAAAKAQNKVQDLDTTLADLSALGIDVA